MRYFSLLVLTHSQCYNFFANWVHSRGEQKVWNKRCVQLSQFDILDQDSEVKKKRVRLILTYGKRRGVGKEALVQVARVVEVGER